MVREKLKWRTHEGESTDAGHRGGPTRSSEEVSVMGMERRGWIIWSCYLVNQRWEEPGNKTKTVRSAWRLDDKSRMTGDYHVWIRGSVGVKFPCATRLLDLRYEDVKEDGMGGPNPPLGSEIK